MSDEFVRVGVGVLVLNAEGKVLLGQRKSKLGESTFSLPGGHLEFGETFERCASRELEEETDIDAKEMEIISLTNDIAYDKHYITIGVLVKTFEGEPKVMETDKCESWKWYDINNLPQPMFVPSLKFIQNFLKKTFYK